MGQREGKLTPPVAACHPELLHPEAKPEYIKMMQNKEPFNNTLVLVLCPHALSVIYSFVPLFSMSAA